MCGILGGNNSNWNYKNGIKSMQHRGPDGMRVVYGRDFTLAFARLAVMDLTDNGMQPMFSNDRQVGIVFNGEIYGYQKLREELIKKGYIFQSTSDTEVILNAYLEWGEKFINEIDGMFAIAVYDKRDNTLKLYRDRAGIKPLYYFYDGHDFGFSSELKGVLNMCNDKRFEIDRTAVYDYLNYLYIPAPKTYYKHVYKLLAGHKLIFDIKNRKLIRNSAYWKLNVNECEGSQRKREDLIQELRELVKESVCEQMVADVPVGTFLSGGVDSSIVTYESSRINPTIESFSIGFTERDYDESKYAKALSERYGIKNNKKIFTREIFSDSYEKLKVWYDEPFADTSAFPTYFVSKSAREKVTVALTGDGADELFGGYPWYEMMEEKDTVGVDNYLVSRIYERFRRNAKYDKYFFEDLAFLQKLRVHPLCKKDGELRKFLQIDKDYDKYWLFRQYYKKELPIRTRVQYLDFKTFMTDAVLTKVDRASMAVSLETRVPFLSRKIIEFAFSLSQSDRYLGGELKGLLKKAYGKEINKNILYRNKMGFMMPGKFFNKESSPQEELLEKIWKFAW